MNKRQLAQPKSQPYAQQFKRTRLVLLMAGLLAGCNSAPVYQPPPAKSAGPVINPATAANGNSKLAHHDDSAAAPLSTSNMSIERYKRVVAKQVSDSNPSKVYIGHPQAMLRSVVVVKYVLDANGSLVSTETLRSNGDAATVATALGALRHAAPYPAPPTRLLNHGRLEVLETMLFNDDGRFQMRSIAEAQLDE